MQAVRSLLFVPADSERKIAKGRASPADALILDLEDSVLPERRAMARELCRATLLAPSGSQKLFVRINALDTPDALADLAAVVRGQPAGIMLPKCMGAAEALRLSDILSGLEARDAVPQGQTRILAILTETAGAMLDAASYRTTHVPRLAGLLWGGEDLAADIGATTNRTPDGAYAPLYQLARSLCLLAATAAHVAPIDAVFTDFRDSTGLAAEATQAAASGFTAKAAIHPDQVETINRAFTPSGEALARAEEVLAAFAASGNGVASLGGRMLDEPHRKAALRLLQRRPAA
jgi:citrate lyase subunit beta/citryl-CoA lyase